MRGRKEKNVGRDIRQALFFIILFFGIVFLFYTAAEALYTLGFLTQSTFFFASNAAVSLSFPTSAVIYLNIFNPQKKSIASRLGLGRKQLTLGNLLLGVFIFVIVLVLEELVSLIAQVTNTQISTNVGLLFAGAPLWFFVFASIAAPVNEEALFRGLMVPRVGIVISALIFAALHFSYGSTFAVDVIAAFIFGLVSGYVFRRTGSLYPSIVGHALVNTLAAVSAFTILL